MAVRGANTKYYQGACVADSACVLVQVVAMVTDGHQRPEIPPEDACPSPSFPGMGKYVELMNNCWKQVRAASRPYCMSQNAIHV